MIDVDRLATWMDGIGLGKGEPIETEFVSGGTQNEIYEVRRGELHCALRIPPPEAPAPRDEGIVREWRIIEALGGTDVPHTEAIAVCTDQAVLGRTFYLMGYVDGWSPMGTDGLAGALRHGRCGPAGPGLRAGRRHRAAVEGRLARQGTRAIWGGPTASTIVRSTAGLPSSNASRAASSPASTSPQHGCGPIGRATICPGSCTATTSSPT